MLAAALLVGPSLASVQFGSGKLMGPFGQAVGNVLNHALGVAGYFVVLALLLTAWKIFATALGQAPPAAGPVALWRRRLGVVLATGCVAVLLHLAGRPLRLADASIGGLIGEIVAELLCSLLSTPGTWIVTLTGLALSSVLATDFSWVGAALRVWTMSGRAVDGASGRALRARQRLALVGRWFLQQLELAKEANQVQADARGTAALPPVVRVDLTRPADAEAAGFRPTCPADLEIGKDPPEPVVIKRRAPAADAAPDERADKERKGAVRRPRDKGAAAAASDAPELAAATLSAALDGAKSAPPPSASAGPPSAATAVTPGKPGAAEEQTLTIVQPSFRRSEGDDAEQTAEQPVDASAKAGFVLHGESYRTPPLSLLQVHGDQADNIDEEAIQQQAARLTKSLADYKIFGKVTEVHPGPVVTMYEFVPAPGTRINKVASLCNDLAMSLHAQRVRIVAPIPGKGAIGIEVPNDKRELVSFKEIVADDAFRNNRKAHLTLALGKNIVGAPVVMDLAKMPHLLVAGATGAGKSVSINSMICSLLMRYTPEDVRLILIDPKFLELSGYNEIPHLLLPVVTDPKQANIALRWAVAEMERRYQLLADMRVRDIASFNRKIDRLRDAEDAEEPAEGGPLLDSSSLAEAEPDKVSVVRKRADGSEERAEERRGEAKARADKASPPATRRRKSRRRRPKLDPNQRRLPYLVVVIDEFADLMMCASKDVETSVARLAQKARACGIHLILATQRPSVDVITGLIKANFPSRIAFQVASSHDSKTILGSYGAENLLGAGDMLVLDRGAEMKRIHGAYISDEEIRGVIDWLREQGRPVYDMEILKAPEEEAESKDADGEPVDALYDKAVALVAETRQASISMIQRRLRIGYNRAARMVEQMERDGIVGPQDGVRGREVLIQHHE